MPLTLVPSRFHWDESLAFAVQIPTFGGAHGWGGFFGSIKDFTSMLAFLLSFSLLTPSRRLCQVINASPGG